MKSTALPALLSIALPIAAHAAEEDSAKASAAARAFQAGQKAQLMGRHREAAEKYELADGLLPTPEALRSALRARLAAGDTTIAAAHAEELRLRCETDDCRAYPESILEQLRPDLVAVRLFCSEPCVVAVDGRPRLDQASVRHHFFVRAGRSNIDAIFDGGTHALSIDGTAGEELELRAEPPAPPPPPPVAMPSPPSAAPSPRSDSVLVTTPATPSPPEAGGLPSFVPLLGFGAAAGLGAAAAWSISDARSAHEAYAAAPTAAAWEDGRSKDVRTNVLFYSALGTAAISAAIAALWTDW